MICDRAFEGHWVHNTPGYRCRHGHKRTAADRPKNAYLPEKAILAKLPLLYTRLTATSQTTATIADVAASVAGRSIPSSPQEVIDYLRQRGLVLHYDSRTRTLEIGGSQPVRVTV